MAHSKKVEEKHAARKPAKPAQTSSVTSAGSSTGPRLRALYVDLASDLDKFSAFVADPHAFAKREGLGKDEMELLFSGDQGRIYASLRPELMPSPPQPQQSTGETGAATQAAAPAPPPQPQGYPGASYSQGYGWPNPNPYAYGYGWPGYWPASPPCPGPFVQTTSSSCPAQQTSEQKR